MLVQFNCRDKSPSTQETRMIHLSEHLAWVENNMAHIRVAGPLKEDANIIGSLYIFEADDIEMAKTILHGDPYYQAQIWGAIDEFEFNAYAGSWVGGKNWPTQIPT
tara:strand:+ start:45983 stop:46300 length:318 start_codon:yes stop_codon:yes gene_type:complete